MQPFDLMTIAVGLLPTALRRPVLCAILRSALTVLQQCHNKIDTAHNTSPYGTYYRLSHNGQVCILETLLNDRHDPRHRRIRIGNLDTHTRLWIYTRQELNNTPTLNTHLHPLETTNTHLHPDGEYADKTTDDFIVFVPTDLQPNHLNISASITEMKLAGVGYDIQYF